MTLTLPGQVRSFQPLPCKPQLRIQFRAPVILYSLLFTSTGLPVQYTQCVRVLWGGRRVAVTPRIVIPA